MRIIRQGVDSLGERGTPDSMDTNEDFPSTFDGLVALTRRLRGPGGCPWDREQTRASMRRYIMEECFELLEAIDEDDADKIVEELGDVLYHVTFQLRLGEEEGSFDEERLFEAVIHKLVSRHTHVFGDASASDAGEALSNWDAVKRSEQAADPLSALDGVSPGMPALAYAQAIQDRAARTGFDWEDAAGVVDKVEEELAELRSASTPAENEEELGDLLFSIVNMCRWLDVDAETALRTADSRFRQRFASMEHTAADRGLRFADLPLKDKEALWQEAKARIRAAAS